MLGTWHKYPLQFATLELGIKNKRGLAAALFVLGPNLLENSQHSVATSPFAAAANFPVKRRGEIAELAFLLKATSLGFGVAKPWGDSDRFDFIITSRQLLWRVQVNRPGPDRRIASRLQASGTSPTLPATSTLLLPTLFPSISGM